MKSYLVFGTVAILSFLACVFFLSPTYLYGNAAVASIQPSANLINHLTSSVSFTTITPAETAKIILPDSNSNPGPDSALSNAMESSTAILSSVEVKARGPIMDRLVKGPIVHITSEMLITDTTDESVIDQEQVTSTSTAIITNRQEEGTEQTSKSVLKAYKEALLNFAIQHNYSRDIAFLINLGMKSGKKRFYVINLNTGQVITRGLVAHGQGNKSFSLNKSYSNSLGSGCSSLGIYKVGSAYYGGYGKAFRLTGLQQSNSNALRRAIVLHAMNCIPDQEINYPICQSEGCPSLSVNFLKELSPIINSSNRPILLWIFDPAVDASGNQ